MSDFLKGLVAMLAGGAQGAQQGMEAQRAQREREAEQKRIADQFAQQMAAQQRSFDATREDAQYGRAKDAYGMVSPDADLTASPLLKEFERFNLPTTRTAAASAPKLSDSLTLPSLPGSAPSTGIGGADSTPMSAGKYDPNAEDESAPAAPGDIPKPLPMGGPITVNTPTYGLGSPGKVTRAETRQESQQRVKRDNEIKMLKELLPQVAPQYRTLLQGSLDTLEGGGEPEITAAMMRQVIADSQPKAPAARTQPGFEFETSFEIANNGKRFDETATPEEKQRALDHLNKTKIGGTRAPVGSGGGGGDTTTAPSVVDGPTDPESQNLLAQTGLSWRGFLGLTGRMSQVGRSEEAKRAVSREIEQWAARTGVDTATIQSQFKAYNDVLEANIERYNRTVMAEGEITADIENLIAAAKTSNLGDARAINAAKQWLKGELNDPNAAEYAFFLNQLTNDIALYNAASQGRAALNADLEEAKRVVQRGIAAGSLTGMQKALTSSITKMGEVLEGGVNRARQNVWNLFGVGDKYKPSKTTSGNATPAEAAAPARKRYNMQGQEIDANGKVIGGGI